jgi:hypothetical protein
LLERRKAFASRKGGYERLVAPKRRSGPLFFVDANERNLKRAGNHEG